MIQTTVIRVAISCVLMIALLLGFPLTSGAVEKLGQRPEYGATLTGPKADAPIPLYLRPAANQPNVGYGMKGDSVTVLEQLASFLPEADPETTWNHVRLDVEPFTEGWVQGKFLATDEFLSAEAQ